MHIPTLRSASCIQSNVLKYMIDLNYAISYMRTKHLKDNYFSMEIAL